MRDCVRALMAAFSTYSAIPMPSIRWDETVSRRMLRFFPAVGLACGLALGGWYLLCLRLRAGDALFAAGATVLPFLITGGIHMDGFLDTVDALASHQSRERRLEILKDPHCGAFAVLWGVLWLLCWFALMWELYRKALLLPLLPCFVLSRALSGLLALVLPSARQEGMLHFAAAPARSRTGVAVLACTALLSAAALLFIHPRCGLWAIALALLTVLGYVRMALRVFGGATGDTAGFFLQLCEQGLALGIWIGGAL